MLHDPAPLDSLERLRLQALGDPLLVLGIFDFGARHHKLSLLLISPLSLSIIKRRQRIKQSLFSEIIADVRFIDRLIRGKHTLISTIYGLSCLKGDSRRRNHSLIRHLLRVPGKLCRQNHIILSLFRSSPRDLELVNQHLGRNRSFLDARHNNTIVRASGLLLLAHDLDFEKRGPAFYWACSYPLKKCFLIKKTF